MKRPTQTQLPRPHRSRLPLCAATPRGSRRVPRENLFLRSASNDEPLPQEMRAVIIGE